MITAISNLIFQSPITCKLREECGVSLSASSDGPERIQATYDLNLQAIKSDVDPFIVPLMLAQTNKNAEKKISRSVRCQCNNMFSSLANLSAVIYYCQTYFSPTSNLNLYLVLLHAAYSVA